ncbi:bifunctional DNA primase/polymerase [Saccharothrix sp. Mg75]|uniref:bifunctional DNA primase/polymerase n=1 Tax=Saccharothrix sp. Mg75 TaxID=3445357 RepID=UPI003EEB4874
MTDAARGTESAAYRAALDYAALGWPVLPGAIWREGRFVDPVTGGPVTSPYLRPVAEATTDTALIREWWSVPGPDAPLVLTVIGGAVGAVSVYESLVEAVVEHPWFTARPTPVLLIPAMPFAFFLVRPPLSQVPFSDEARVVNDGVTLPLPPSAMSETAVTWLVSPEEAGNVLLLGDELGDLIRTLKTAA